MKTMHAGSFKTNFLTVLDEVWTKPPETVMIAGAASRCAKLVPANSQTNEIYNFMAGKGVVTGDVVSPAISTADWNWHEQF